MNLPQHLNALQANGKLAFSLNELADVFKEPKENLVAKLYFLRKKGRVVSPLQGLYIIIPLEDRTRGSLEPADMVVLSMKHLNAPYYAGLLTAASYYGAAHQAPQVFQVVTNKRMRKPWVIGRVRIEFIYKKDLQHVDTQQRIVSTGYLNVSSPEETVKDLLTYHKQSGGLNHQATVLSELIEVINVQKLLRLAKKTKKLFWIQRMGYILEKIEPFAVKKRDKVVNVLTEFLADKNPHYVPLSPRLPTQGAARDKKWKIIENSTIESDI